MPHSRGGPHRLGGRAAPLRCRDAQASPRRIAEAAVLVPALGPGLCLRRPAPGIRHSAFGTRPPALTFDSAIRPPTLPPAPDSRSVDAAPIRVSGGRFNSSAALFCTPPRAPASCIHALLLCIAFLARPSFQPSFASLPSGTSPPPLSVQHDALCVPPPAASLSLSHVAAPFFPPRVATSCRHLVSPSFCASVPPSFCASARLPPDAFFPLFLGASPLPRTNTPRYVIPRKGRRLFRSGPAHKTKKPKICSLVVIYSPFRLNIYMLKKVTK